MNLDGEETREDTGNSDMGPEGKTEINPNKI